MLVKDLCLDYFWIMPKTPKYVDGAKIPYITSKNLKNGKIDYSACKYITEEAFKNLTSKRYIQEEDFLISMIGTVGEVGIVNKTDLPIYGQNMYLLRPNYTIVDKRYLYNFLSSTTVKSKLLSILNGATQGYLRDKDITELNIANRSLPEQKKIAEELDNIRNIVLIKKKELLALDELVKSRFIEMFKDKGYPSKSGKELFKFTSGKFLIQEKRMNSGIPVYGGNGIAWYTEESLIDFDTIIIGRVGAYCGNARLVRGSKWITDNALYISQFKTDDFSLEFLEELMIMYDFHQYAGASAQPKITQKPLEEQMYLVPPKEEQIKFAKFANQIDKS